MLSSGRFLALLLALTTVIPTFAQVVIHDVPCSSTNATGLCWDGAALWVSDYSTSIRRINPADGSVIPLERGEGYTEFACLAEAEVAAKEYALWAAAESVEAYLEQWVTWGPSPVLEHQKLGRYWAE